jgi:hypothetical protein
MKKLLLTTLLLCSLALCIRALCDPQDLFAAYEVNTVKCPNDAIIKQEKWFAYFPGYNASTGYGIRDANPFGYGWCQSNGNQCWPDFDTAIVTHGIDAQGRQTWQWKKVTHDKNPHCQRDLNGTHESRMSYTCPIQLADAECGLAPGFDGSCPPGTYPSDGMCCTGNCNGIAASSTTATFGVAPSLSLAFSGAEHTFYLPTDIDKHIA